MLLGLAGGELGCRKPEDRADARPRAVVERFIELRSARKYTELEPLVVADQALQVSAFVARVDRFLDVNRRLCEVARDRVAVGVSKTVDQSYFAAALGLFGDSVEVLDERLVGDQATVTYLARDRVPAEEVMLRRVNGTWKIDPGAGFSPLVVEAFAAMADGLERLADEIESGRLTAGELLADTEELPRRVQDAMRRGVELLSKARTQAAESKP